MASRKDQKQQAREQRIARERELKQAAQRKQRLQIIGGIVAAAVVVVVVLIVVSAGGGSTTNSNPTSKTNVAAQQRVNNLLENVPQDAGNAITMGDKNAKVTITLFGDLECSVCDEFDLDAGVTSPGGYQGTGYVSGIINDYVKTGKAKFVYKSLETATSGGVTPNMWTTQQAAANAAALQGKGWHYVELFYNEQGAEKTDYVTDAFLEGIAKQIKGLDYAQWYKDWKHNSETTAQVASDNTAGTQVAINAETAQGYPADQRGASTPTVVIAGPNGQQVILGPASPAAVGKAIAKVS